MSEGASIVEVMSYVNPVAMGIVFIYGALLGSFLNVVIYRLPLERSIVLPGSACGVCGTPLSWWENLPVVSYCALRGRCHTCGSSFSCRYAIVEFLTGLAAVYSFVHFNASPVPALYSFVFFCFLLVVFFMDLDHWIVLDSVSLSGTVVGLVGAFALSAPVVGVDDTALLVHSACEWMPSVSVACGVSSLLGILLGVSFFWSIQVVGTLIARQEALGSGDIKLAGLIGAFLGWQYGLLAFFLSFVIGATVAVLLMVAGRKKGKDPIPLGTFMAVAAVIVVYHGEEILGLIASWPQFVGLE